MLGPKTKYNQGGEVMRRLLRSIRIIVTFFCCLYWVGYWSKYFGPATDKGNLKGLLLFFFVYLPPVIVMLYYLLEPAEPPKKKRGTQSILRNFLISQQTYLAGVTPSEDSFITVRSFDGGLNWYRSEESDQEGIKSLKPIETFDPFLLPRLNSMLDPIKFLISIRANTSNISEIAQSILEKERNLLCICGRTRDIPKFKLRSFDGGKNWFVVTDTENGGLAIRGRADEIYPDLLPRIFTLENHDRHASQIESGCLKYIEED